MDRPSAFRPAEDRNGSSGGGGSGSGSGSAEKHQQQPQSNTNTRSASPSNGTSSQASSSIAGGSSGGGGSSSLFGWMKTAFSSPLNQGHQRTGSPASGRSSLVKWTSSSSSSSPVVRGEHPLPSRNLEAEMDAGRESLSGTDFNDSASIYSEDASVSGTNDTEEDTDGEEEDDDDEDEDEDEDEELYEPFKQQERPGDEYTTDSSAASLHAAPGLVRPTARRSVSLNHGGRDDLIKDVAQLNIESAQSVDDGASSVVGSVHKGVVVSDTDSRRAPPSLVLTPPDSRESAEITSPITAGWAGPSSPPSGHSNALPATGDGGSGFEATDSEHYSRESVALGSRSAAMRAGEGSFDDGEEDADEDYVQGHGPSSPPLSLNAKEDWDDARAKTPKVFSDLYRPTSITQVMDEADGRTQSIDPRQAAAEIAETATPTPRPSDPHPTPEQSSPKMNVKTPTPMSPGRLRLFGNRRRTDSNAASSDGASIKEGVIPAEQASTRPPLGQRTSSNTPFWRRGRKASNPATTNTTLPTAAGPVQAVRSRHQVAASPSQASGLSVEALESASDAMYSSSSRSRAPSIAPSEARSAGASSRGRCRAAKAFGLAGETGPKRYKSRAKNKPSHEHNFSNLYLAQELYLGIPTPSDKVSLDSAPSSRKASVSGSTNSSLDGASPQRPPLASMDSEGSLNSTISSTVASSVMSHSTVGSYGAHGKRNATWAMKFSQDGRYLAVAGQDMIVRVFAVLDTAQKRDLEVQESQIRAEILHRAERAMTRGSKESLQSHADEEPHAHGGSKSKSSKKRSAEAAPLKPIPVFNSRPVREFAGHVSDVLSLDWSKGNFLLSSAMDKTVKIWHLTKPECLITFGHGDFVTSAVFHPKDDRFFLSGSLDGKLRLWNIAAKRVQATAEVPGLITATSFSASGSTAIAGTFAGALLFYNTEDLSYQSSIAVRSSSNKNTRGRKITGIEAVNNITPSTPTGKGFQQTKIEELILISSNDSRVRVFSLTDKRLTAKYRGSSYLNRTSQIRASSADDTYVVAGSESGEVYVWDSARESAGFAAGLGKKASSKGLRGASSKSGPISSQSYECWAASDHARPITVALLAPIKTHTHLTTSEDPVELHSAIVSQGRSPSSGTTALSALGLAGALSAAMPSTLRPGSVGAPPPPGWDVCKNRVVVSVDESQIVRVWRAVGDPHVIGSLVA